MFQGSANLEKLEHFRYVQSSGGTFNGSTHVDYTNYFEALPSNALERGLFLEADRMRSPRITEENLANQLDVVKNEIRVNVLNRPYGGFPWIYLPAVLYDSFANSHNGYGGFEDLESATVDDATDFFKKYYAPGNAVLAVTGDVDVDETLALVEKHFAGITKRRTPKRPSFGEPPLTAQRRTTHDDPHAPIPALALGYRVPDPIGNMDEHLAHVLLTELLTDGDASRLQRRLVQRDHLVTDIAAYIGMFGDPFDERDPTGLTISAHYPDAGSLDAILTATDEELARVAEDGLEPGELDRVRRRLVATLMRELDPVISRALEFAKFELIHGQPDLIAELPQQLDAVSADAVRQAAAALQPERRAVLELIAGGAR
jgi:predicted Zn-dependent peptidase